MKFQEDYQLPLQVQNRGQFTVSVASQERKDILLLLLEKTKTNSVGQAAWEAIVSYVEEDSVS